MVQTTYFVIGFLLGFGTCLVIWALALRRSSIRAAAAIAEFEVVDRRARASIEKTNALLEPRSGGRNGS